MLTQRKLDYKTISIVFFLLILCLPYYFFRSRINYFLRSLLELRLLHYVLWCLTLIIFIVHYFKFRGKEIKSKKFITQKFGDFMDSFLGGITYGTGITSSLTLIKGFYIQNVFGDIYFKELDKIDLWTVFASMIFLLYYMIMKVVNVTKETIWTAHVEKVVAESKEKDV